MKFSSLSSDSEPVCLSISMDNTSPLGHAVLFIGFVGLTRLSDVVARI